MKWTLCLVLLFSSIEWAHSEDINKQALNNKSRVLLDKVQAKLAELSKINPLLEGIAGAKIVSLDSATSTLFVMQELTFEKNVQLERDSAHYDVDKPQPTAGGGEVAIINPGGIIFQMGISDHPPKIPMTEEYFLGKEGDTVMLYLRIQTQKNGPEIQVIRAAIDPLIKEFIKSTVDN